MLLSEAAEIWIYGFGARGRFIEERLAKEGIDVSGYIDRKAAIYAASYQNKCFQTLEDTKPFINSVVICSLANVFVHETVAKQLAEQGFQYIVYMSFERNAAAVAVRSLYNRITELLEESGMKHMPIPLYEDINKMDEKAQDEGENSICANIPVELLFGLTRELLDKSFMYKDTELLQVIPERSLLYYTLPKKMLQFFEGEIKEDEWEKCRRLWCAVRNAQTFKEPWKEAFDEENQNRNIQERHLIYEKMEELFQENPIFFQENPITVIRKKGRFHIEDGNNRAAFLLTKGKYYIPAKMTRKDYESWIGSESVMLKVKEALGDLATELRVPVLHPRLKEITCSMESYSHRKVAALCDWLWRKEIDPVNMSTYEYFCENDLCGSHVVRMGGRLAVCDTKEQINLHKALDRLYLLGNIEYYEEPLIDTSFEMVISNEEDALSALIQEGIKTKWYILEFKDKKDSEIEIYVTKYLDGKPEFLIRQLVGTSIYKTVIIEGES